MHIVVEWLGSAANNTDREQYLNTLLRCLTDVSINHSFTLLTDKECPELGNIKQVKTSSAIGYFKLRHWYRKGLPGLLQQQKADFLISVNGAPANTTIPQVLLITSVAVMLQRCNGSFSFLYKRYITKKLRQGANIATISNTQKNDLAQQFGLNLEHVKAIGYAVPTVYRPLDWQQRETFLQNRTGGKEFFLYTGDFLENEFLLMLKAFSLFKKRQQSNMQLIVAGHFRLSKNLQEKIDTYKYRQDVVLLPNTDGSELPMLTAAAYTLLFANQSATIAYPVAAAMQCGVPVIGFETNKALVEAADAAALYATPTQESLAEQMKLVYKDEALRQQLIYHTQQQAGLVNGKIAAQNLLEYHAGK